MKRTLTILLLGLIVLSIVRIDAIAAARPLLVFVSERDNGRWGLRVAFTDGSVSDFLTPESLWPFDPVWSPDGTRIAFTGIPRPCVPAPGCVLGPSIGIWVINADGTAPIQVNSLEPGADARGPSWSPDGKKLVYMRETGDYEGDYELPDLWVLTEDAPGVWSDEPLVQRPGYEYLPDFSPDGRKIAYAYAPDDDNYHSRGEPPFDFDVYVSDADGSGPHRRVTRLDGRTGMDNVSWFPDGNRIAFSTWTDGLVWVTNIDGSHLRTMTPPTQEIGHVDVSPDGRHLAFVQCVKDSACRVMQLAVGDPRRISTLVDIPERMDAFPDYFPVP